MIDIIDVFFKLYAEKKIDINWYRNNPGFNLNEGPRALLNILEDIGSSTDESELNENDIIDYFFLVINNRIRKYYGNIEEDDFEITRYIDNNMDKELLKDINKGIFLDNNIIHNRFVGLDYEILSKRDTKKIDEIKAYNIFLSLEGQNNQNVVDKLEVELKLDELENLIDQLSEIKNKVISLHS